MSIVEKGQTWLPKFWRRAGSARTGLAPVRAEVDGSVDGSDVDNEHELDVDVESRTFDLRLNRAENPRAGVKIHPMASVDARARIAPGCEIGPFCIVGPDVELGENCRLIGHVTILGKTKVGRGNAFYPNSVLGVAPQDKKFHGEQTRLEIGDNNDFREACTVHLGTEKGGGVTRVGNGNLLMVNCHIAHDVKVGNNCVLSNNVMIAGHCQIGNGVVLAGGVGMHHFVTVDDFVYAGGYCEITHDVPPFVKVDGSDRIRGLNSVGMRRNGFTEADVEAMEDLVYQLFLDRDRAPLATMLKKLESGEIPELSSNVNVQRVVAFMRRRNQGKHGRYLESLRA